MAMANANNTVQETTPLKEEKYKEYGGLLGLFKSLDARLDSMPLQETETQRQQREHTHN